MRSLSIFLLACCLMFQAACSVGLPRVHKVTVQQGNVITQDMIDRLEPGMTRSQVAYIMGEPVYRNPFENERWDYVYTLTVPGFLEQQKRVSLYFEEGVLAYFTGDYAPSEASQDEQSTASAAEPAASTGPQGGDASES
jgi:outer membrane protein assembly factor BamE